MFVGVKHQQSQTFAAKGVMFSNLHAHATANEKDDGTFFCAFVGDRVTTVEEDDVTDAWQWFADKFSSWREEMTRTREERGR